MENRDDGLIHKKIIKELSENLATLSGPLPAGAEGCPSRRGSAGIGQAMEVDDEPC
jgi:hypothetical protein